LVDDVDAATERAKQLGGKVSVEPSSIANLGRCSVIVDPTGAAIALHRGV
jgi:uncharacterized protein